MAVAQRTYEITALEIAFWIWSFGFMIVGTRDNAYITKANEPLSRTRSRGLPRQGVLFTLYLYGIPLTWAYICYLWC